MRFTEFLSEGATGTLYHVMEMNKADDVFINDAMPARWMHEIDGREVTGNSFSRNPHFWFDGDRVIRISIDLAKLRTHNKVLSVDAERAHALTYHKNNYFDPPTDRDMNAMNKTSQFREQFVVGNINNIHRMIEKIEIRKPKSTAGFIPFVKEVEEYAKKYNIPLVIDPSVTHFINQINSLDETYRLPLRANQIAKARGSYGAFIVTMLPTDFLRLTTPDDAAIKAVQNRPFPETEEEYEFSEFGKFEIPFLTVRFPDGKILGHEGRHRAAMILRNGGNRIPVIIYPRSEDSYCGEATYYDETGHRQSFTTPHDFPTRDAAEDAVRRFLKNIPDEDILKIRASFSGNYTLKGEPNRSDGWDKAAWRIEDFPKQLIGQDFYPSSNHHRVSDIKVGLVKGYRHFRR